MSNKKFLRMYCPSIWPKSNDINNVSEAANNLELRTIIQDFRTKDNTLSIWNLEDPVDAALGLINPNYKLSDVFFINITEESLLNAGLKIKNNKGNSIFTDLNDNHFDILDVNYTTLKKVAEIILDAIKNDQFEIVISKEIMSRVKKAIDEKIIDISLLPKEMRKIIMNNED